MLGLRHRRRRLYLRAEDGGCQFSRGVGHAGRPRGGETKHGARAIRRAKVRPAIVANKNDCSINARPGPSSNFTIACSKRPEAEAARAYLAERGISAESIARFHLGFAPDSWDWLLNRAQGTRYTPQVLESVGLVGVRRSGQGHYDRFKGRVLFSIRDNQGRPVGLGGRILPGAGDSNAAKYINSPETVLFAKSKLLYGLDLARQAMRKSQTALVMEGYTDCIVAQQSGFENAVAVLGTALGEEHVRQLKQYADRIRIVLVLDGDEAGRKRANEVLKLFVAENVDLRVCTLVGQKDPCDFLLENGPEAFEACVQSAPDALEHARRVKTAGVDLGRDVQRSSEALSEMLAIIAQGAALSR